MRLRPLRRFWLWILLLALVAIIGGTLYAAALALGEDTLDHRLAALAVVFGAAAFVIAVVAGLLGLLAYNQSLARPDLAMEAKLGDGSQGWVCAVTPVQAGNFKAIAVSAQSTLFVTLVVKNSVSARQPAVKIAPVDGLVGLQNFTGFWRAGDRGPGGHSSARWDGGASFLVHAGFPLTLEGFQLGDTRLTDINATRARIRIEWVADGIQKRSKDLEIILQ